MALYKGFIAFLLAAAACNPVASFLIAIGRVSFPKSNLPYAHFSKLFLGISAVLLFTAAIVERFV